MDESTIRQVLEALSDAGLCVCEVRNIGPDYPAACHDFDYVIGLLKESGGLDL